MENSMHYTCIKCGKILNRVQNDIRASLKYECDCGACSPTITYAQDDIREFYSIILPWLAKNTRECKQ